MEVRIEFLAYSIVLLPILALPIAYVFHRHPRVINYATIGLSLLSLVASIFLANDLLTFGKPKDLHPLPFLTFYLDSLSIYFVLLVNLVAFLASIYTIPFLKYDQVRIRYLYERNLVGYPVDPPSHHSDEIKSRLVQSHPHG